MSTATRIIPKTQILQSQVDDVKDVMIQNIEKSARVDDLTETVSRPNFLNATSQFKKNSGKSNGISCNCDWAKIIKIAIAIVALAAIAIGITALLSWSPMLPLAIALLATGGAALTGEIIYLAVQHCRNSKVDIDNALL